MKVRWTIFLFLGGFAMLAYVQRTSLGVAAQNIMPDLHLSQLQIGWLNAAFATCYTLALIPGGVLGQRELDKARAYVDVVGDLEVEPDFIRAVIPGSARKPYLAIANKKRATERSRAPIMQRP